MQTAYSTDITDKPYLASRKNHAQMTAHLRHAVVKLLTALT